MRFKVSVSSVIIVIVVWFSIIIVFRCNSFFGRSLIQEQTGPAGVSLSFLVVSCTFLKSVIFGPIGGQPLVLFSSPYLGKLSGSIPNFYSQGGILV